MTGKMTSTELTRETGRRSSVGVKVVVAYVVAALLSLVVYAFTFPASADCFFVDGEGNPGVPGPESGTVSAGALEIGLFVAVALAGLVVVAIGGARGAVRTRSFGMAVAMLVAPFLLGSLVMRLITTDRWYDDCFSSVAITPMSVFLLASPLLVMVALNRRPESC